MSKNSLTRKLDERGICRDAGRRYYLGIRPAAQVSAAQFAGLLKAVPL
jgi:hypothetical protein